MAKRFRHFTEKTHTNGVTLDPKELVFVGDTREIITHGETYGGKIGSNNAITLGGITVTPVDLTIKSNNGNFVSYAPFGTKVNLNITNGTCINVSSGTTTSGSSVVNTLTFNHSDILDSDKTFTITDGTSTSPGGLILDTINVSKQGHISNITFRDLSLLDIPWAVKGSTSQPVYISSTGPEAVSVVDVAHGGTGATSFNKLYFVVANASGTLSDIRPYCNINSSENSGTLVIDRSSDATVDIPADQESKENNTIGGDMRPITAEGLMNWNGSWRYNDQSSTNDESSITHVGTITHGTWLGTKIANNYIANPKVTIAGNQVNLGESLSTDTLKASLGLSSFKVVQTAVNSPSIDGNTTAFIDTISQNTNGVITATKKNLDTTGTWSGNAGSATKLANARTLWGKSFDGSANIEGDIKVSGISTFSSPSATTYGSGTNGQVLMSNGSSTYWGTINIPEEDSDSYITYTRYSFILTNGKYLEASLKEAVSIPTRMTLDIKVKGFRATAMGGGPQIIRGFDDTKTPVNSGIHVYGGTLSNDLIFCSYERKNVVVRTDSGKSYYSLRGYLSTPASNSSTISANGVHLVHRMDKTTTTFNGTYTSLADPSTTYTSVKADTGNDYLNESVKRFVFNSGTNGTPPWVDSGMNITYMDEILLINTDTNEILMLLVPVKRSTDDKCGFYDMVSKSILIDESGTWSVTGATAMGLVHKELIMPTDADTVDGFHIKLTSLSAYTSLSTKDSNTLYIITS